MADASNSITEREAARLLLEWQVAFGADEALSDEPVDRLTPRQDTKSIASPSKERPVAERPGEGGAATFEAPSPRPSPRLRGEGDVDTGAAEQTARALAAAATNLEELKAAIQNFMGGTLREGATNTVFAGGNPDADLMLVGEAPGREEDLAGLPFVGRSGQLLDRMLAAIGLDRKADNPRTSAYITKRSPLAPTRQPHADDRRRGDAAAVRRAPHRPCTAETAGAPRRRGGEISPPGRDRHPGAARKVARLRAAGRRLRTDGDADPSPGLSAAAASAEVPRLARPHRGGRSGYRKAARAPPRHFEPECLNKGPHPEPVEG